MVGIYSCSGHADTVAPCYAVEELNLGDLRSSDSFEGILSLSGIPGIKTFPFESGSSG